MNSADQVTDFKLSVDGRPATVQSLLKAINAFCGKLAEEYDFSTGPTLAKGDIPAKSRDDAGMFLAQPERQLPGAPPDRRASGLY